MNGLASSSSPLLLLALLGACADEKPPAAVPPPPYGIISKQDDQLYAGVARVDLTPTNFETFTDLDNDAEFDGCMTDPDATRVDCEEPFNDLNGDGRFDGVWIAGYQSNRAATGVHDPITATAVVLSLNGEYVTLVGFDALGILENRIRDLRDMLEADGYDRNRIVVSSSHSHSAPDTAGIWGPDAATTGTYAPFVESIAPGIYDAITVAAAGMVPVSASQGITVMSTDPTLNGEPFGGINPDPSVLGGMNDIRDPILAADEVWALALDGADGRVATVVSASGHPETSESNHTLLSADYVGYMRDYIERADGGTTVFLSGALGGMQSSSGGVLPSIDTNGARVLDGAGAPVWLEEDGFAFAETWGVLVAQAAQTALSDSTPWTALSVKHQDFLIPVNNISFKLAFQIGILDTPDSYVIRDETCPEWGLDNDLFGCVPAGVWMVQLGPSTLASFPGELFPELFYGVPDEPAMTDASLRQGDRRWVQDDPDCAAVDFALCKDAEVVGDCDCLQAHAAPYVISATETTPIRDMLPGTFHVPIGIANAYCGYIVPEPDFNTFVSVLTDDGDHYEETNSCSKDFGTLVLDNWALLVK